MVYPFAMKYIYVLVAMILLARIDFWINLFEKTSEKFFPSERETSISGTLTNSQIVSWKNDRFVQSNPKEKFFSLLEDFKNNASPEVRLLALEILKKNPGIIKRPFDKDFEAHIFRWRDLLVLNQKEVSTFVLELMKLLR